MAQIRFKVDLKEWEEPDTVEVVGALTDAVAMIQAEAKR